MYIEVEKQDVVQVSEMDGVSPYFWNDFAWFYCWYSNTIWSLRQNICKICWHMQYTEYLVLRFSAVYAFGVGGGGGLVLAK